MAAEYAEYAEESHFHASADIVPISGGITAARGMKASGVFAGVRKARKDIAVIYSDTPARAAGVYTTNKVKAAPVLVCMDHVGAGTIQAIGIVSGNANACTGEAGLRDAYMITEVLGRELGIDPRTVACASTGVIGVRLPMDKVVPGMVDAARQLSPDGGRMAAESIMTTDTFAKECAVQIRLGGAVATIGAMAKGSGMIHPNMATMLCFVASDAAIEGRLLESALKDAVNKSFNCITVDGDTSTNDMVIAMANGLAGNEPIVDQGDDYARFQEALQVVCQDLAKKIVMDGEGASKLVEVAVVNAATEADAKTVAMAIAKSELVKTAIFGADANWGRIMCAAGYSGADFDPSIVDIYIGPVKVAERGMGLPFSEERAKEALSSREIMLTIDMKSGPARASVWTCDLTFDYVKINASYRS
ncbi:MAG: bifunctional glutamate N-acetyltransferase/amino-acid acetyltransferase ArgJ [Clostridia bacterium]|nr:bifunctional glutamate N-acetyltransferase/amino-acid acetyltransferase ArgJ [Clostridia bacterium]